eukprot:681528-Pelagomonas_calceolata.AAC.2
MGCGCRYAFLPLDPSWPLAHLHGILRTAQPLAVLFDSHVSSTSDSQHTRLAECGVAVIDIAQLLSQGGGQEQHSGDSGCQQNEPRLPQQQQPALTEQQESNASEQQQGLQQTCRSLPYFCVMFTSGSTGLPAGEGHP